MISYSARGLSMDPLIQDGDLVFVQAVAKEDIQLGDILAYRPEDAQTLIAHRLIKIGYSSDATVYMLQGDFSNTGEDKIGFENISGRVVGLKRQDRLINLDTFYPRLLKFLWRGCPFLGSLILLSLKWPALSFKIRLLISPRFFIRSPSESLLTIKEKFNQEEEVNFHLNYIRQGFEDWEKKALENFIQIKEASVLNLGCGAGREALALANLGFKVTGVDIAPEMIYAAGKIAESSGFDIRFEAMSASEIDFPENSFDYCLFSRDIYSFIPSRPLRIKTLERIKKCLKPGGLVFLSSYIIPRRFLSAAYFLDILRRIRNFFLHFVFSSEAGDSWIRGVSTASRLDKFCFCHFFYSLQEITDEMKQAGFSVRESGIENILMAENPPSSPFTKGLRLSEAAPRPSGQGERGGFEK